MRVLNQGAAIAEITNRALDSGDHRAGILLSHQALTECEAEAET